MNTRENKHKKEANKDEKNRKYKLKIRSSNFTSIEAGDL